MTTAQLVFNRRAVSPSGVGTTLQWGDLVALAEAATLDFTSQGACAGAGPDEFYLDRGHTIDSRSVCADCPVRPECLAWALSHESHGVWGGTSVRQRRALRSRLGLRVTTPAALPPPCGSFGGYRAHRRAGEEPCVRCRRANSVYLRERHARAS